MPIPLSLFGEAFPEGAWHLKPEMPIPLSLFGEATPQSGPTAPDHPWGTSRQARVRSEWRAQARANLWLWRIPSVFSLLGSCSFFFLRRSLRNISSCAQCGQMEQSIAPKDTTLRQPHLPPDTQPLSLALRCQRPGPALRNAVLLRRPVGKLGGCNQDGQEQHSPTPFPARTRHDMASSAQRHDMASSASLRRDAFATPSWEDQSLESDPGAHPQEIDPNQPEFGWPGAASLCVDAIFLGRHCQAPASGSCGGGTPSSGDAASQVRRRKKHRTTTSRPTSTLPSPTRSPGAKKRSSFTTDFSVHRPPCSKREHVAWRPDVISKPRGILLHEPASPGFNKVQELNAMPHAKQSDPLGRIVVADLRGQCCFISTIAVIRGEIFRVLFWATIFLLGGIHMLSVVV